MRLRRIVLCLIAIVGCDPAGAAVGAEHSASYVYDRPAEVASPTHDAPSARLPGSLPTRDAHIVALVDERGPAAGGPRPSAPAKSPRRAAKGLSRADELLGNADDIVVLGRQADRGTAKIRLKRLIAPVRGASGPAVLAEGLERRAAT
jgi:hypothetical protein